MQTDNPFWSDGRLYWRNSLTAAGVRKGSSGLPWRGIDIAATGQHWKFTRERLDELGQHAGGDEQSNAGYGAGISGEQVLPAE